MERRGRVGIVVAAVLVCGGCAAAPAAAPVPPPGPRVVLAPRPVELRLDGVDPCAILTPAQRADLGLDGDLVPYRSTFEVFGNPQACSIGGFEPRTIAVDLAVVTTRGIEVVTEGGFTDALTATTVGGMPAVLARTRTQDSCTMDIDVAAGQMLEVVFADGGGKPTIPQDRLCRDVVVLAEAAVASLRGS